MRRREPGTRSEATMFAVDLMAVATRSGLSIDGALRAVAEVAPEAFAGCLVDVVGRADVPLALALRAAAATLDPPDDLVLAMLADAVDGGFPVATSLDALAAELRRRRRHEVEVAARRLPVALLVPMVVCLLPATLLVTIVPALLAGLERLAA